MLEFIYRRIIRIQDTDATGVLYFANQFQISLEAFEEFMRQSGFSLDLMIEEKKLLLPIVHTEGDFFMPLKVGDEVDVSLSFTRIGNSSFTYLTKLKKKGEVVGRASIVHVTYSPEKKRSQPIPSDLKKYLTKEC